MTRAVRLLCDWLFEDGVGRLELRTHPTTRPRSGSRTVRLPARGARAQVDLAARRAGGRDRLVAPAGRPALTVHSAWLDSTSPVQNWMLTELDSGERVISERLDHVRSAAVGYWIGAGSRDEEPTRGRGHALHRAPALQGHRALQRARDRRDLRRARRRAERRDLARAHARLRARPRPPPRDRGRRDERHGLRAARSPSSTPSARSCSRRSRCTRTRRRSSCTT